MIPKHVAIRRLRKLADHLHDNVSRKQFDMVEFIRHQGYTPAFTNDRALKHAYRDLRRGGHCGTVGCIAGHAAAIFTRYLPRYVLPGGVRAGFSNVHDWIGPHVLGIDQLTAHQLFFDNSIRTPKQAAKRLRQLADQMERAA